jgi:two-component system, cell cycle sensor histidine kinase and response regulator CckA
MGVGYGLARPPASMTLQDARFELFDAHPVPTWVVDLQTLRFLAVNDAAVRQYGYTREEFAVRTMRDLQAPDEAGHLQQAAGPAPEYRGEWVLRRSNGTTFQAEVHAHDLSFDGRRARLVAAVDISTQKRAEAALRESERLYESTFDHAPVGIALTGLDGRWLRVNRCLCDMLGYTPEALAATSFQSLTHSDDVAADDGARRDLIAGRIDRYTRDKRYCHRDGHYFWARLTVSLHRDEAGVPRHFTAIVEDVSERKAAEQELDRSERLLHATFEEAGIGMAVVDLQRRPLQVNAEMRRMLGYTADEFARLTFRDLTHPDDRAEDDPRWAALVSGSLDRYVTEKRYRRKDGRTMRGRLTATLVRDPGGRPLHAIGMIEDITEYRNLEAQFQQAQKLEAVGRLAGGVAHDFNNLLTAIIGYTELVRDQTAAGSPLRPDLEQVLAAGESARALTRQLLAFSRRGEMTPVVLDANAVVAGVEKVLRRVIGDDVRVVIVAGADLGRIKADPGYVEQVLMNLAVNARDAMPHGGALTIETANVDVDEAFARTRVDAHAGPYVRLSVGDTGTGMTPDVLAQIFEPFFTTKEAGKGTGLGLATVYGIVKRSGGFIDVESAVGAGSTFRLHFPRVVETADRDAGTAAQPAGAGLLPGGSETVLLVEDDERLRMLATRVLERHGYRVLSAADAQLALAAAGAYRGPIDLLFTDVVLPGLSGHELAVRLREMRHAVPVLYTTGDPDRMAQAGAPAGSQFLQKPYTPAALLQFVRRTIDGAASASRRGDRD